MSGEWITLEASDGHRFQAWHETPAGILRGRIVVAMEIFGVNAHIREVCARFAAEGYEAVAPQLYDRALPQADLPYDMTGVDRGRALRDEIGWEAPMLDVAAAASFLRRNAAQAPVGIVGYCYGGTIAWLAAGKVEGIDCAVGYYGTVILSFTDLKPKCPTMLHFGARDHSTPEDQIEALAEKQPGVAIHLYDADHGFNSDRRANFDADASKLALERTLAFFAAHLG